VQQPPIQQAEIGRMLKWLMGVRVAIVSLLLGVSSLVALGPASRLLPLYYGLIAFTYLLTIGYALALQRMRSWRLLAHLQLGLDLLLETVLVYATGGADSPFAPFYIVTIVAASLILDRRAGYLAASAAAILNGVAVDLRYYGIGPASLIDPAGGSGPQALYLLFLNIVAFFTVAYLSGSLAAKLHQTRERLEEKSLGLAQLQAFHEDVVQSISSGMLTTDTSGRITSLNRAGSEITGYDADEVRGRPWWAVLDADDLKSLFSTERPLARSFRCDRECTRKDGARVLLGMTVSPLRDQAGEFKGGVWVFQDLTRIKALEEEMKRREWLATIGELAAGMAHEIRNPLAALSGSMQVLRRDLELEGEDRRLMDIALKETERLNSIISSFLLYARPAPLNPKRWNVNDLLYETLSLLRNAPEYREGITLEVRLTSQRLWASVDADKLRQVFWNLAINAIQAMPRGGRLIVSSRRTSRPLATKARGASWIEVAFADEGEGIAPDMIEKIFYPFFTTKDKGSGLGLSIVHRIIENHHGYIHVRSQAGRGATFTVYLPAQQQDAKSDRAA
jgi:two-component system sensor histidine kinase PilS (NtrC family)